MRIRSPQRGDVGLPRNLRFDKIGPTPSEARQAELDGEQVGGQPRVASIAVGERMNRDQPMVEAHGDLGGSEGLVANPVAHIVEQLMQFRTNAVSVDPDIAGA